MRRFDEAGRLDRVCQRGELRPAHLSDLAATLAAFHAAAASAPARFTFWRTRAGARPCWTTSPTSNACCTSTRVTRWRCGWARLEAWTQSQFTQLAPLLRARKRDGRVRECRHGDLHRANLVLIHGRVRLFDCLEFNEDLR